MLDVSCKTVAEFKTKTMNNSTVQVRDVILPEDINDVRKLWLEYLIWGNDEMQSLYGVHPHNPLEAVEQDIELIDKFLHHCHQFIRRLGYYRIGEGE